MPGALERAEALAGRILKMCVEMGGSITGEHGVGMEKRDYLPDMFTADEIDCMRRLRAAFDPARDRQSRQNVSRRRSAGVAAARAASAGEGGRDFAGIGINIEQPTPNIEHPMTAASRFPSSMFDVECSVLDVERRRHSPRTFVPTMSCRR